MDKTYPPEAWKRLGEQLRERRGELGYGFRQRKQFLEDRGGPPPSGKMLDRIENGSRTYYPDATIATLERIYGYQRGSFEAILQGAKPAALQSDSPPRPALRLAEAPGQLPEDPTDEEVELYILAQEPFTRRDMLWKAWRLMGADRRTRLELLRVLLAPPPEEREEREERRDTGGA